MVATCLAAVHTTNLRKLQGNTVPNSEALARAYSYNIILVTGFAH